MPVTSTGNSRTLKFGDLHGGRSCDNSGAYDGTSSKRATLITSRHSRRGHQLSTTLCQPSLCQPTATLANTPEVKDKNSQTIKQGDKVESRVRGRKREGEVERVVTSDKEAATENVKHPPKIPSVRALYSDYIIADQAARFSLQTSMVTGLRLTLMCSLRPPRSLAHPLSRGFSHVPLTLNRSIITCPYSIDNLFATLRSLPAGTSLKAFPFM
jgi:DUF2945 family protein